MTDKGTWSRTWETPRCWSGILYLCVQVWSAWIQVCVWMCLYPDSSTNQQSVSEGRALKKDQTGSWALRGQVHFYPNEARSFDVMRTWNDLIGKCQFSLNLTSPVSPLTRVLWRFLILNFGDLKCQILNRALHWDVLSGWILIKKSCFTSQLIFHLIH